MTYPLDSWSSNDVCLMKQYQYRSCIKKLAYYLQQFAASLCMGPVICNFKGQVNTGCSANRPCCINSLRVYLLKQWEGFRKQCIGFIQGSLKCSNALITVPQMMSKQTITKNGQFWLKAQPQQVYLGHPDFPCFHKILCIGTSWNRMLDNWLEI